MLTSSFERSLQKWFELGSSHIDRFGYSGACGWSPSSKIVLFQQHLERMKTSPGVCNEHQGSTTLPDLLSLPHTSCHIRERMNLIISRMPIYTGLQTSVPEAQRWNCVTPEPADPRTLAQAFWLQIAHALVGGNSIQTSHNYCVKCIVLITLGLNESRDLWYLHVVMSYRPP